MTVLEEGLKAYIEAQVASAGHGFPQEIPDDEDVPAWSYETVSDDQLLSHNGGTGYYKARVQLNFMAKETATKTDYQSVKEISSSARAKLDGFKGTMNGIYVKYCKTTLSDDWSDIRKLPSEQFDVIIHYRLT